MTARTPPRIRPRSARSSRAARRFRVFGTAAAGCVFASGLVAACALDWTVRGSADASLPTDTRPADAAADVDARPPDAQEPDADADATVGPDGAAPCDVLTEDLARTRREARRCVPFASHCQARITDQCGCFVAVAQSGTPATIAYQNAIDALVDSGCNRGCATPPGCPVTLSNCIQQPEGATCSP